MATDNIESGWGAASSSQQGNAGGTTTGTTAGPTTGTNAGSTTGATTGAENLGNTVNQAVDSAKQTASQLGDQVRQQLASRADEQRETAATGLTSLADAVRRMGEGLKNQDQTPVTQFASHYGESLAGQVDKAATYLRNRDAGAIMNDLESLARRRPAAFLSGAFILGLLGSRFLKSSRPAPDLMYGMPDPKRALPAPDYTAGGTRSWPTASPHSEVGGY
ncbi:MAG: hypothetical protein M3Z32_11830 [Acidobacteriota bacterium]|nr:hypothetical protein [Acidobacteriota bacterium]